MASGSDIPRKARADVLRDQYAKLRRERELANARVEIRADLGEDEDTGVIDQRMLAVQGRRELPTIPETPIPVNPNFWQLAYAAIKRVPPWGLALIVLAGIAAYTLLALRGRLP